MSTHIEIKNARVHNLKGVDLSIPRNKFIVITGLSGSGKSSLAFDTLYAEGQRRYVESLSAYVRQFLGRMNKPEVDYIKGIPPAIAIEQKVISNNPRSTVGTTTEIYEYIKLLYARIGRTYSPISGSEVKRHSVDDVIEFILSLPEGTTTFLLAGLQIYNDRSVLQQLEMLLKQGFSRVEFKGEIIRLQQLVNQPELITDPADIYIVVDRVDASNDKETINRLYDSIETAFFEGNNSCLILYQENEVTQRRLFSKSFEADGIAFDQPNEKMFSFNNPLGACPTCEGFGKVVGIDPHLVVPNPSLSVYDDAVVCWRGEVMKEFKNQLIFNASKFNFPIHKPYYQLSEEQKELLWNGNEYFEGINAFFGFIEKQQHKVQYRVMLARYRGKTICPTCKGTRLKPETNYVKIDNHSITQLVNLPISDLKVFFDTLNLSDHEREISKRLMLEITSRMQFLLDVGLGYLTLNRQSNTLSGGESQRINLATSLGSSLVGSLYILDEPSIGLHPRDTARLIKVLRQLQELGNTVVVVEHDEEIMRAADYIIDIGPNAGSHGGEVVLASPVNALKPDSSSRSYTLKYLFGEEAIEIPKHRRKWSNYIEVIGATTNNLKGIDVKFPLNVMTVVTGVSGSGKSSLIRDEFYTSLKRQLDGIIEGNGSSNLKGSVHLINGVEFVNQNPIGKSSRSNPVTYLKAYDEIRKLFSDQPSAKQMGFTPAHFSFNVDGGRCEACQGEGTVTVEMQFMADLVLPCEECHGTRFKKDVLEVTVNGKNIHDILEMTVDDAILFFGTVKANTSKKIIAKLRPLQEVGIGYVKLGQSSSTLSGGESQRVKLASFLSNESASPMMFIFDEPTTGLHMHDIKTLMKAFDALITKGHTLLIIEHNTEVIKCADYLIDLGPDGGNNGGNLVFTGTPEEIINCAESFTGQHLKPYLTHHKQ